MYKIAIGPMQLYVTEALTNMIVTTQQLNTFQRKLLQYHNAMQFVASMDVGGFSGLEVMIENLQTIGGGN